MKKIHFLFIVVLWVSSFLSVQPALAHGDEPRLEINAERLNPGSVLEIRGVDFEFEEEIAISLIGSQTEIPFGTVTGDTEGVFQLVVTLPVDLAEGMYTVRATTDDHVIESPQLTVWGAAQIEGGEGVRAEDDGLLAPMPTYAPGVSSTPMAQPAEAVKPQKESGSPFILVLLVAILVLGFVLVMRFRSRS